jgi:hypothetical protein
MDRLRYARHALHVTIMLSVGMLLVQIPPGYVTILEEVQIMRDKAFHIPGLAEASWNKSTPPVRFLVRQDWLEQIYTFNTPGFETLEDVIMPIGSEGLPGPACPPPNMVQPYNSYPVYIQGEGEVGKWANGVEGGPQINVEMAIGGLMNVGMETGGGMHQSMGDGLVNVGAGAINPYTSFP